MIVVTVELWPLGDQSRKRHLGTAKIANTGRGSQSVGNYTVWLSKTGRQAECWKTGALKGFKRLKFGAWDLLALALIATLGDRLTDALAGQQQEEETCQTQSPRLL